MGVPEDEWPAVVDKPNGEPFRKWRNRSVYSKIGVSSSADLQARVWIFVERMSKHA
jgi:hypothetical protein